MPSPGYSDALRRRLQLIDDRGTEQTSWERGRAALAREKELQKQYMDQQNAAYNSQILANQNANGIAGNIGLTGGNPGGGGGSALEKFINSIGMKESSNNYSAVNKNSGAMGKYQIMPSNIRGKGRGWDWEALGRDVSTTQFMQSPEIQEKIARYKLQKYYEKYGPAGASIAWYAGPSAAQKYANTGYASTAPQNGYPSIAGYMDAITNGMKWG